MPSSLVLSIPREYVNDLYKESAFIKKPDRLGDYYKLIREHATFKDRNIMEKTTAFRQIVACCIIYSHNKVLCLKRSAKSNRKAIRLKFTLLVGGHVDEADREQSDPILSCILREVKEELGIELSSPPALLGLIGDARNTVGLLHLAVVFGFQYDQDFIRLRRSLDVEEFTDASIKSDVKFWDVNQIKRLSDFFDPWSSLVLKSGVIEQLTSSTTQLVDQHELPLTWQV